jgi:hypothetical protein
MGPDPLKGRRQGVETPPELIQTPSVYPTGELPPNVSRIDVSREEEPSLEDGLLAHDLQQAVKLHGSKMPRMANYCNGIDYPTAA